MTTQPTPEQTQAISEALATGGKIEAIKIYRTATGTGLKEAKEFIDELVPKLIEQNPLKYQKLAAGGKGGCASMIMLTFCLGMSAHYLIQVIG